MSNFLDNKKLYEDILAGNNLDQNTSILSDGYGGYCDISVTSLSSIDEFDNALSIDYSLGTIYASGSGSLNIVGLPSFVSNRIIFSEDNVQIAELYIAAGQSVDYEAYGTGSIFTTWSGIATIDLCTGTFNFTLFDRNDEGVSIGSIPSMSVCSGGVLNRTIQVYDGDRFTSQFRQITLTVGGDAASLVSLSPSSFTAAANGATNVNMTINTIGADLGTHNFTVNASDDVHTDSQDVIVRILGESFTDFNQYNLVSMIPQGLSGSFNNPIVVGHRIARAADNFGCIYEPCSSQDTFINNNTQLNYLLKYRSSTSSPNYISLSVEGDTKSLIAGNTITGQAEASFLSQATNNCCGLAEQFLFDTLAIGNPLETFVTGIGQHIPFSGGIGNVEASYFEPLGKNKTILVPQSTGFPLSSNDDYFYVYTYGQAAYSGIKHPTETGLSEVVGSASHSTVDTYILCRYASSTSKIFKYNSFSSTWSDYTPFEISSDITRIIKLDRHPGLYFVVGAASGEYAVYNAVSNVMSSVNISGINDVVLPANMSLISDNTLLTCNFVVEQSETMVSYSDKYHIFALNHHYTGSNIHHDDYPLLLDVSNLILTSGAFDLAGSISTNTTYLHSYLNYRTDIVQVADKMAISLSNTGTGGSEIIIRNNTTNTNVGSLFSAHDRRRLTKLVNDQILWSSYSSGNTSIVVDPYSAITYSLPIPLTGSISVAVNCPSEYRTLMLNSSGNKAYILNDLDRTYEEISFSGMDTYHDIFVFNRLNSSVDQAHNFYLMPTKTYETGFPTGHLLAISTTTTSAYGINLSGDFTINETVLALEPNQTTTGLIPIGSFTLNDDEFNGGVNIGFAPNLGDASIFYANISGSAGTIYVKSGIALDYESKNLYTGYITGVDPYVGGVPFIDTFVMEVLDVDEKPTSITIIPNNSGTINTNTSTTTNVLVANFSVTDPDNDIVNVNVIDIAGPDRHKFVVSFNNTNQNGSLYLKAGTVFDINVQEEYNITLLASKSGEGFSASADWRLILTDNPPVAVVVSPNIISLREDYIIPTTGLKLANFSLVDNDTNKGNYVNLIGLDSDYFTIDYDLDTNLGTLRLSPSNAFDYESQSRITGLIAAGNTVGVYSATGTFIINVLDVYEPTGIRVSPSIVYIDEDIDTSTGTIKLADLSWSVDVTDPMVIFDVRYTGGGFRSALDKFQIVQNVTLTPEIHLQQLAELDYETQNRYDIYVSGRPSSSTTNLYGGYLIVIVRDVNEAPIVSFNPTGILIPETAPTNAGRFKIADVLVADEELSTVTLSLTGVDSHYFTLVTNTGISDSAGSIDIADLYFNSGVVIDIDTKNTYTASVVAIDSSGLSSTGNFIVNIGDVAQCDLVINADITNTTCGGDTNGRIFLDITYTGTNQEILACNTDSPISVRWNNLPSGAITGFNGTVVNNLPDGSYYGYVFGGNIPLTGIGYTISRTSDLELLEVIKNNSPCETSGTLTVTWRGGVPPYVVSYGTSSATVPSGSGFSVDLTVLDNTTANTVIRDSVGCQSSGAIISFDFINSVFTYESQSPPTIYDDTLESFQCYVSHGPGPYEINVYNTTTGEKGSLAQTFDRYDTSIINRVDRLNNIITDASGNQSIRLNNPNPQIYYYDFQNKIYPGQYLFEFINTSNCSLITDQQILQNIAPLTAQITASHDNPVNRGFYTISQPILDTLFIPYKMLVNNSYLLSYLSNVSSKSDIHLQIGDTIYDRKILDGSINCDTYSILNIKFLGLNTSDWFYTLPIYQGFDLTDTTLNILNQDIYLVLPNNDKIKIVTQINNNVNTIKLLKGSILTTDFNTAQYKNSNTIELFNYDFDLGTFISMNVSNSVTHTETLYNKYNPGNIFRIDFLNNTHVSLDLRSDNIEEISFDCNSAQREILNNRSFLIALNSFGLASNIYSKAIIFDHSASITILPEGAYPEYSVMYYYYNKHTKCLSELSYNNQRLNALNAEGLMAGVYIIKLRDIYGNILRSINNTDYDYFYISALDFILNDLDTTAENLHFEYGDVLLNLVNLTDTPGLRQTIPGIEPETPVALPPVDPPIVITTNTYVVSPNTEYNNAVTIQTSPGKIPYSVIGPHGYNKKFLDRSILVQLPPGVYTIMADQDSLQKKYLYPQIKKLNITKNTNILVNIVFDTYQDRIIIKDSCQR